MSFRLAGISLFLRLVEKPRLARMKSPMDARAAFERAAARIFRTPPDANLFADRIRGPAGDIPIEWVSRGRPDRRSVVLYLHGGAYMMGSPATHRHLAARLAGHSEARALVPAYRLAPETRWPGAVEDALSCYRELLNAGYDAGRIAFAGDSAGGGLAFATLIAAREAGLPDPACIAAFSPWIDLTLSRKSLRRNARSDPMLPASRVAEARDLYVSAADAGAATASPLLAAIPSPPPVLIQASRIELLEDEAAEMAEKLREAGGDVRLEWFARTPHAMQIFCGLIPEADKALVRAGAFIRSKLGDS
ncbi:alpha/beta hydrolase [Pikeienuella sp. HZG-20]|uniref:alpha/beta hydrolase n=1 Tax=Paludibacillus litoralis TaxID=3133267 RepID=UPI0030ED102E